MPKISVSYYMSKFNNIYVLADSITIDTHQILASYKACLHAVVRRYLTVYILLSLCAGQYGRWSTDSCRVVSDNGATTHCVCTQLGHFSLIFVSDTAVTIA